MFLRAAATACTLSTVLQPPPSVHGTSQRSTHQYASFVSSPSSEGSVPLSWLLPKFLRRRRRQKRSQHSPSAAASLSPWHLTEGHSQHGQRRVQPQLRRHRACQLAGAQVPAPHTPDGVVSSAIERSM
jgi:hypothetical protein